MNWATSFIADMMARVSVEDMLGQLETGFANITDQYMDFLRVQAKFHNYSLGNQLLIMIQKPEASRVAGFRKWQELGRQVRKGEKAIRILAPCFPRTRKEQIINDEGEEEEINVINVPDRMYFKVVSVFDVSQTDGDDLPEGPEWPVIEGDSTQTLFNAISSYLASESITVEIGPPAGGTPEGVRGFWQSSTRKIWIREGLPPNQQTGTLAHECSHALLGHEGGQLHRDTKETQAQSLAFILTGHFGFDLGDTTFPYLFGWRLDSDKIQESRQALKRDLELVKATATKVIDGVAGYMVKEPITDARPAPRSPAPQPEPVPAGPPEQPRLLGGLEAKVFEPPYTGLHEWLIGLGQEFDWTDWISQIAGLQRCANANEEALDQLQRGDPINEADAGELQEWLTCLEDQAFIIPVLDAMEAAKVQLGELVVPDETLATYETLLTEHRADPCTKFIWLAKRTSRFRTRASVTTSQYQRILGKKKIPAKVNLLPGKLVPWEIAVDEPADELGINADEFERCILLAFDRQFELFDLLDELQRKGQNVPTSNFSGHSDQAHANCAYCAGGRVNTNGTQDGRPQGRNETHPWRMYLRSLPEWPRYSTLPHAQGSPFQRQVQIAEQRLLAEVINGIAFTLGAGLAGFALRRVESSTGVDVSQDGHLSEDATELDVSGQGEFISEVVADVDDFEPDSIRTVRSSDHRVLIACPLGKWNTDATHSSQECQAHTKAIAILHPRSESDELIAQAERRKIRIVTDKDLADIEKIETAEIERLLDKMMAEGILSLVLEP